LRALTWTARGEADDLAKAQKTLARIRPLVVDPYRRALVTALSGIVRVPNPVDSSNLTDPR
jgi:hypothetical protein